MAPILSNIELARTWLNGCIFSHKKVVYLGKFPGCQGFLAQEIGFSKEEMDLTEQQIVEQVDRGLSFPPLKVVAVTPRPTIQSSSRSSTDRPDLAIDFAWQGKERSFLAKTKRYSTPKAMEEALRQAQKYVKAIPDTPEEKQYFPLLVVPYLSPKALERLIEENVSGIDLSGNGVVIVPGDWFVYRSGAPNRYPMSALIKNVFRGTSSLVARVFLMKPEFGSVNEIYEEIKRREGEITLPTVSKALKALEEELVIARGKKIRLLDSGRVLDLLEQNYRRPPARRRLKGKFNLGRSSGLGSLAANADNSIMPLVGDDPTRYALMPGGEQTLNIYTTSIETALRGIEFAETNRFPEVELIETDDPTVYFDRRRGDDFYWTSPLAAYLTLSAGGKRERETAEQMREDIKEFKYYK